MPPCVKTVRSVVQLGYVKTITTMIFKNGLGTQPSLTISINTATLAINAIIAYGYLSEHMV